MKIKVCSRCNTPVNEETLVEGLCMNCDAAQAGYDLLNPSPANPHDSRKGICSICGRWDYEHISRIPCTTGIFQLPEPHQEEPLLQQDQISKLIAERGQVYGPSPFNQETVAQAWKATLESHFQIKLPGPIPSHIVALMMIQLKVLRAACPFKYHQDDYDDLHGYAKIAEICAKTQSTSSNNEQEIKGV